MLTANPQVGHDLVYQFTVTNNGPDTAHTVVFTHTLPSGLQDVSADSSAGAAIVSGSMLTANLGTLASGASATITVTATPNVAGSFSCCGSVNGFEPDPNSANNTATFQATVAPGALDTDLAVTMSAEPGSYQLGDEILYTITIANNGPRVATGINLSDTLPTGAQFISLDSSSGLTVSGGTASVFVGALAPGDSLQAFVSIKSTVAGDITNTATVTLIQTDSNSANNTFSLVTHILPGASVTVLSGTPNSIDPGDSVNFSASVVSPAGGHPTGTVTFREGTTVLGHQDARRQQPGEHQPSAAHVRRAHDHGLLQRRFQLCTELDADRRHRHRRPGEFRRSFACRDRTDGPGTGRTVPDVHLHGDEQWTKHGHERGDLAHSAGERQHSFPRLPPPAARPVKAPASSRPISRRSHLAPARR